MEALKKINGYTDDEGKVVEPVRFHVVAQEYSEDKARAVCRCRVPRPVHHARALQP